MSHGHSIHGKLWNIGILIYRYSFTHVLCQPISAYIIQGLVSLFNGISTFVGYLMPNLFSKKNSSGTIQPIAGKEKGVHTFPKGICPKVNVIARLEYELAYYDSAVHHFNHYTTRTTLYIIQVTSITIGRWITACENNIFKQCRNILCILVFTLYLVYIW